MNNHTPPLSSLSNGVFRTLNKRGYTSNQLNSYTQAFLDAIIPGMSVLDIGAGFGAMTLEALERGAVVTANDMEIKHLNIIRQKASVSSQERLKLKQGLFNELDFPSASFDLILISQVLHFLTTDDLVRGINSAFTWLKPQGKIYITATTPFAEVMKAFLPVYTERKKNNLPWPGVVENITLYCTNQEVLSQNPIFMNFLDPDILKKVCEEAGFVIHKCEFFGRNDFPEYLQGEGKENVGLIAIKPDIENKR